MQLAGQTPHGARPNREGAPACRDAHRLGAPQPPGRPLELRSNARPRGMAVLRVRGHRSRASARDRASHLQTEFGLQVRLPTFYLQVPRLRSGFRRAARTPRNRLNLQVRLPTFTSRFLGFARGFESPRCAPIGKRLNLQLPVHANYLGLKHFYNHRWGKVPRCGE